MDAIDVVKTHTLLISVVSEILSVTNVVSWAISRRCAVQHAVSTGSRVKHGVSKSKAYNSQANDRKQRHSNGDKSVYACEQSDFSDSDVMGYVDSDDATDIGHVDSGSNFRAPIWVTVCIEGKSVEMELDTGAVFSIMSTDMFKQFFGYVKNIHRSENLAQRYRQGQSSV